MLIVLDKVYENYFVTLLQADKKQIQSSQQIFPVF